MKRKLGFGWSLLLVACGANFGANMPRSACADDTQCAEGQLCFPDGCADPSRNVVVEVVINTRTGHHAQDLPIDVLSATQDLAVQAPLELSGTFLQLPQAADGGQAAPVPYTGPVVVRAVGESALIPGVLRRYEASFAQPERGEYTLALGAGLFTVTATPADTNVPSDIQTGLAAAPGASLSTDFHFALPPSTVRLSGRLVRTTGAGLTEVQRTFAASSLDIQALDPATNRPLSQRVPLMSGTDSTTGEFVLELHPNASKLATFQLVVSPREPGALLPAKRFTLTQPLPSEVTLNLGDYGEPVTAIGTVVDGAGAPVADAAVFVEGTTANLGTFRSRTVRTDVNGQFTVDTLTTGAAAFSLTVLSPKLSRAASFRALVRVKAAEGTLGAGTLEPAQFTAPQRLAIRGTVLDPQGEPAAGTKVVAEAEQVLAGVPLPAERFEGSADLDGTVELWVDPARYRLDFLPTSGLPRRSWWIEPKASGDDYLDMDFDRIQLSRGSTLSGSVTALTAQGAQVAAPNASLRFFRITTIAGKQSALLLGETVSDERGAYSVTVPAR